ncbi:hypothetical protein CLAFUR0_03163 [Fulvia fulva]|nr:hypothetical protein CLAFUR0_03163 [Fulvia fulva]
MQLTNTIRRQCSIDLCETKRGFNSHQLQCRGCNGIEELLAWLRDARLTNPYYEGVLESGRIHRTFAELDGCASSHDCVTCQVIRRAFYLAQITQAGVKELTATSKDANIFARLHCTAKHIFMEVVIGSEKFDEKSAWILCSDEPHYQGKELAVAPLDFEDIFINLKPRIDDCHDHHRCSNLGYSLENPSWLVELLPHGMARLVKPPASPFLKYVSLSYSWGKPANRKENEIFKRTAELTADPHNFVHEGFSRSLLPLTLQDAMRITEAFEVQYIWIDRLCIPKRANWDDEASKMHEVFGNAYFTLAATGAERAWDPLDTGRQAWSYRPRRCQVDAYWLSTIDMSLNDMRVHAPLSQRGWVMQEERLSPRVLYWCGQRAYWSCAQGDPYIEGSQGLCDNRASKDWSHPQAFLRSCYRGDATDLEEEWLDIVASYVRRDLYRDVDRFLAISGLATRYLDAKSIMLDTDQKEEYLAGLWRGNIARGLGWAVPGGTANERLNSIGPTWSWASLPLRTEIKFGTKFVECPKFTLLTEYHRTTAKNSMEAVNIGAKFDMTLDIEGQCRDFISKGADIVPWNDVCIKRGSQEHFVFKQGPQKPVYARDADSGRVLSYEAHQVHVVGQLDYLDNVTDSVPEEKTMQLLAFEVSHSAMLLLLVQRKDDDGALRCARVGVACGYRKNFFAGSKIQRICLV